MNEYLDCDFMDHLYDDDAEKLPPKIRRKIQRTRVYEQRGCPSCKEYVRLVAQLNALGFDAELGNRLCDAVNGKALFSGGVETKVGKRYGEFLSAMRTTVAALESIHPSIESALNKLKKEK